jgi:hypothetical protein
VPPGSEASRAERLPTVVSGRSVHLVRVLRDGVGRATTLLRTRIRTEALTAAFSEMRRLNCHHRRAPRAPHKKGARGARGSGRSPGNASGLCKGRDAGISRPRRRRGPGPHASTRPDQSRAGVRPWTSMGDARAPDVPSREAKALQSAPCEECGAGRRWRQRVFASSRCSRSYRLHGARIATMWGTRSSGSTPRDARTAPPASAVSSSPTRPSPVHRSGWHGWGPAHSLHA